MSKTIKKIIIGLVVVGLLIAVSIYLSGKKAATTALVTVGATPATQPQEVSVGEEFLDTLINMQAITLNGDIFSNPAFTQLKDYSITLIQLGNQGRLNPFAAIGVDGSTSTVVEASQVTTTSASQITSSTASVNGSLGSGVVATERWFEWGLTQTLGAVTTKQTGSGTPFSLTISGLTPSTTYYVKAVAKIGVQIVYGSIVSFKTLSGTNN